MRSSPFFIIGSPRSGTTLLRLMLTTNPELVVPPECGFVVWLYESFGRWKDEGDAKIKQFASEVSKSRKFETWGLRFAHIERALLESRPRDYAEACSVVYKCFGTKSLKPRAVWGDKNNHYLRHIATLDKVFSRPRFIHIVRDGRDIVCSYREVMMLESNSTYRPSFPTNISEIARQWSNDLQEIQQQLLRLGSEVVYELRYEDLVSRPIDELVRLCEWLGVYYTPEMLEFYKNNRVNVLEPKLTLDWKTRTLDPVNPLTVGRYRAQLSEFEIDNFIELAGSELRRYGYIN